MEKNDAGLRFAFGVTAMTTDRNASRQVAVKVHSNSVFGLFLSLVLNSVWTHTFYRKRKEKLHTIATKSFRYYEVVLSVGVATFLLS